jgi:hypothetical protein
MQTQPTAAPTSLLTQIVAGVAQALSARAGESVCESTGEHAGRTRIAAATIMDFAPRDTVEAMLAGHCVMFHHLIVEDVEVMRRGEQGRVTRAGIVAMDRAFGANLTRLARYRTDRAKGAQKEAAQKEGDQTLEGLAETTIADRASRHQNGAPVAARTDADAVWAQEGVGDTNASPATTAGEADPARSIPSAETDQPSEAWLASAATQLAGLNRQARREFGRQARKRMSLGAARTGHSAVPAPRGETVSSSGSG